MRATLFLAVLHGELNLQCPVEGGAQQLHPSAEVMSKGIGIQPEVAGDASNRHTRHAPLAEVVHHGVE